MNPISAPIQLQRLLVTLEQSALGRQLLASACPALGGVREFLADAAEREQAPLVVRPAGADVWELGPQGDTIRASYPGAGLVIAHATFAREALTVAASAGSVRENLRRAAAWADHTCPPLAEAIRAVRVLSDDNGHARPRLDACYRRALILK